MVYSGSANGSLNQLQSAWERCLTASSRITMVTPLLIRVRQFRRRFHSVLSGTGLRRKQLTERKTSASDSSGLWMKQVNRAIAQWP